MRERSNSHPVTHVLILPPNSPGGGAGLGEFPLAISMMRLDIPRDDKVYGEVMRVVVGKLVGGGR